MTDDDLLALCLAADPFDYWADVTAWRPPSLTARPEPVDGPQVLQISIIPPVAGGAPGLLDDIKNAIISVVWDHIVKPVIDWLFRQVVNFGDLVGSQISLYARVLVYSFWRWWQDLWWPLTYHPFQAHAERRLPADRVSMAQIVSSLWRYPINAVHGWIHLAWVGIKEGVWAAANWLWKWIGDVGAAVVQQVNAGLSSLVSWVGQVGNSVAERVWAKMLWLHEKVWGWVNWIREKVIAAAERVEWWVRATTGTLAANLTAARDYLVEKMWGAVMAGASSLVGGLRDAFDFIYDKISAAITSLGNRIVSGFRDVFIGPIDSLINTVNRKLAIPSRLIRGRYSDLLDLLDDLVDPGPALLAGIVGAILLGMMISMVTASIMTILVEPLTEPHAQKIRAGVGVELLQPTVLEEARNRELVTDADVDSHLSRAGYSGAAKEALKELRHRIPGSSDLVRFAVREAFDPGLAGQLGFVTPLPGDFSLWMERQGFATEWAERYWWAHWDLPSVTQGFEMLHRGVIQLEDLKLLLRAQDVAPLWQDRLVEIAYTLPSRVDLRRMLRADIIIEAEVLEGYTKRGYDPFWAQALTDFAVDWATPEDRSEIDDIEDATAAQIRQSYRRNVIGREEALDYLVQTGKTERLADFLLAIDDAQLAINPFGDSDVDVRELTRAVILDAYAEGLWDRDRTQLELDAQGYLPGSADLLLARVDLDNARSLTRAQTDLVRRRYVTYEVDDAGARAELDVLGIPVARRELLIAEWAVDRQAGTRNLSLAQIRNAAKEGLIDQDDALARTLRLGYTLEDATIIRVLDQPELAAARQLSRGLVERLLRAGQLTPDQAVDRLQRLGFTEEDARGIVASLERQMERSLVERLLKQGLIDRGEAGERLERVGYDAKDAELIILSVEAKLAEAAAKKVA